MMLSFMAPDIKVGPEELSTALTRLSAGQLVQFARELVDALEDDDSRATARAFLDAGAARLREIEALDAEVVDG